MTELSLLEKARTANAAIKAQRSENEALRSENATLQTEKTELELAIAALVPPPVDGEEWNKYKNYTTGNRVVQNGVNYVGLKASRGKAPEESPEHWEVEKAPSYPHWNDLSGFIEKGTRCIYPDGDGVDVVWECQLAHNKFSTFKPKDGSEQWERVT